MTSGIRVLLVEDDEDDYVVTRDLLAEIPGCPFQLERIKDYETALEAIARNQHDVYLLDYRLGERTGLELLQEAVRRGCQAPIILFTGQGEREIDIEAMKAGAADYLTKGQIDAALLERSIRYAIERRRDREALRHAHDDLELRVQQRTADLEKANERLVVEIVERKQAELAVHEQREWLRVTLTSIGDAVIVTDEHGNVTFMNPVAQTLTGWTQAEADRKPLETVFRIIHERTRQPVENPVEKVIRRRTVVGLANHTVLIAKDGTERSIDDSAAPIRDELGRIAGVVLIFRDVTERRMAEEAIRTSESRFRQLADAMPQIVWTARPDGFIDYFNRRWFEYTGFSEDQTFSSDGWKPILYPDDVAVCEQKWAWAIQSGEPYQAVYRFKDRQTGGYRWHLGRAMPVRDATGAIVRWFGTCTDIDDQKRAEDALKDADRRKDEFLAMLAHELRNPLAPIRNGLHILRMSDVDAATTERVQVLMEQQVRNLTRLVDDLLDVSRITRGKIQLQKETIDLATVLDHAVETVRPLVDAAKHELSVSIPHDALMLDADPTRLEQIVTNLLTNAAKYTQPGGHIWLTAERDNSDVVVRVRDSGIGMSDELLPHIFDMFTQADRTLDRSQGGLGIGLTLVRRLVELHGGAVLAHSDGPDKGSEFMVRLPALLQQAPEPAKLPKAAETSKNRKLRVLVVEDEATVAEMFVKLLDLWGHSVQGVHDGPAALTAMADFSPEVILCDIGLPGMNGYELAGHVRHCHGKTKPVLVAITGYGQEEDQRRAQEAGFDHHMTKPVDPNALEALLIDCASPVGSHRRGNDNVC
jgi:PAS domain S-box-containing protein